MELLPIASSVPSIWENQAWPAEVHFLMSVLEEHCSFSGQRRKQPRAIYRVKAALELLGENSRIVPLFTRDANSWALGFISNERIELGGECKLHLPAPGERIWCINCSVLRCSEIIDDWYEGAVYFEQEQAAFCSLIPGDPVP